MIGHLECFPSFATSNSEVPIIPAVQTLDSSHKCQPICRINSELRNHRLKGHRDGNLGSDVECDDGVSSLKLRVRTVTADPQGELRSHCNGPRGQSHRPGPAPPRGPARRAPRPVPPRAPGWGPRHVRFHVSLRALAKTGTAHAPAAGKVGQTPPLT